MKKVYFFGTGLCAKKFAHRVESTLNKLGNFKVMGFLDNDVKKIGSLFRGYKVFNPNILKESPCDMILLFLMDDIQYEVVFHQLSAMISSKHIHPYYYPLRMLLEINYRNTDDIEIRNTLKYISSHKITVFNQFIDIDNTYDEVKWDYHADLPYIDFSTIDGKTVPMYFPPEYGKIVAKSGGYYVKNLLWEQSEGSPHVYIKQNHKVEDGDCIIDAGVAEGNFALQYINIASHIYLFEPKPIWQKPLKYTFQNCEDKVTIINKAVSDSTSNAACRIDEVVSNHKVNFVKMDVEGAELSALRGAEQTFLLNNIKASICSYHRSKDEKEIRGQLEKYGYCTTVSDGYMLFLYSDDTWEIGDFRRGIVYAAR